MITRLPIFVAAAISVLLTAASLRADPNALSVGVTRVPVVFSEGHETDPRDRGRPVVLVAAALGVSPDVFRDAFSQVHPADPRVGPTGDEARKNKAALMGALGKYGITNERLDTVSNYYRYVRGSGELWTNKAATVNALVKDGVITGYEIVDGGAGYSSPPKITVPGAKGEAPKIELALGKDLATNGRISAVTLPQSGIAK